jgi:hypothetical protein
VVREFEFGVLAVGNPYRNSWRENFVFKGDYILVDIVTCMFGGKNCQRSQAIRNKLDHSITHAVVIRSWLTFRASHLS